MNSASGFETKYVIYLSMAELVAVSYRTLVAGGCMFIAIKSHTRIYRIKN
jgi:hypothetical protein